MTAITYVLSVRLDAIQYNPQDSMYDYQNLILREMMAEKWNISIDQDNHRLILNDSLIRKDLNKMHLKACVRLYYDKDNDYTVNGDLDFNTDVLKDAWSHNLSVENFDHNQYFSRGGTRYLSQDVLYLENADPLWITYGEYGEENTPATFIEIPISNSHHVIACWFIMDYPLPADIDWPTIILPFAILTILSALFWIISSFLYPIKLMQKHVRNLKRGNLKAKIQVSGNDELKELADTINKMTTDIDLLVNQKQNLLIDVSHELKTPLTRMKFLLANMDISQENKNSINAEINSLQAMISNMLLSDKLSTPYIEDLNKENVLSQVLIKSTCDMFYELEKKVKIINKIPDQFLYVDQYKLSLAIKNLIDNALKYGQSDKLIQLEVRERKNNVEISVTDYGPGIHKEQIKKITKPLYRSGDAKTKSGFGLGLAITKKIIEAHQGKLKIESSMGVNTTFTILVPLSEEVIK